MEKRLKGQQCIYFETLDTTCANSVQSCKMIESLYQLNFQLLKLDSNVGYGYVISEQLTYIQKAKNMRDYFLAQKNWRKNIASIDYNLVFLQFS